MSSIDPHGEEINALIAATLDGAPEVVARLDVLTKAGGQGARAARLRLLVALVNARRFAEARALVAREGWENENFSQQPAGAHVPLDRFEIDALFALAVIHNEPGRDTRLSRRRFARVMSLLQPQPGAPVDATFWSAVHGVVITSDRLADLSASATALLAAFRAAGCSLAGMPEELAALSPDRLCDHFVRLVSVSPPGQVRAFLVSPGIAALLADPPAHRAADVAYALAQLETKPGGDSALARRRFSELRAQLSQSDELYWHALRGELDVIARTEGEPAAAAMARSVLAGRDPVNLPHDISARARNGEVSK